MVDMPLLRTIFITIYTFVLVMVAIYGLHRWVLVALYYRCRNRVSRPKGRFEDLPPVTIQLPMYNEKYVAERIIEQTCKIDYPADKLQIQVLDDSVDETVEIAAAAVDAARRRGHNIEYIHRDDRVGYKAGALENGLKTSTGEFVAIFDADFMPKADCLRRSIDYFTDPKVCVVQTRWVHINREDSMLTRSQAILLDGHFIIEHVARNRSGRFMSFNGTAGMWRRAAIEDAGGWQHDTLTEDMDLSYRAQLRGWKFVFLPQLTAPAELPPDMAAFKAQQHRWTKGGTQTALKLLPRIWLSKAPLKAKIEATFHLTSFTIHLYMLVLILMLFPAIYLQAMPLEQGSGWRVLFDLGIFSLATVSAGTFYVCGQFELFRTWRDALKYLPFIMALGVGMCLSNAKAVMEALFHRESEFVRTPKFGAGDADYQRHKLGARRRQKRLKMLPLVELIFAVYMATCAVIAMTDKRTLLGVPFLAICAVGFAYVSLLTFHSQFARRRTLAPAEPDAAATATEEVRSE